MPKDIALKIMLIALFMLLYFFINKKVILLILLLEDINGYIKYNFDMYMAQIEIRSKKDGEVIDPFDYLLSKEKIEGFLEAENSRKNVIRSFFGFLFLLPITIIFMSLWIKTHQEWMLAIFPMTGFSFINLMGNIFVNGMFGKISRMKIWNKIYDASLFGGDATRKYLSFLCDETNLKTRLKKQNKKGEKVIKSMLDYLFTKLSMNDNVFKSIKKKSNTWLKPNLQNYMEATREGHGLSNAEVTKYVDAVIKFLNDSPRFQMVTKPIS